MKKIHKILAGIMAVIMLMSMLPTAMAIYSYDEAQSKIPTYRANALALAEEGTILLKNENKVLPFDSTDSIALFGEGQIRSDADWGMRGFQVMGGGSAWGYTYYPDEGPYEVFQNLEAEGRIKLYDPLTEKYLEDWDYVPDEAMYHAARKEADTAVMIITRWACENVDMEPEDWYISKAEDTMLKKLSSLFPEVVVVINTGNIIQTDCFIEDELYGYDVDAVVWATPGGEMGPQALVNILMGDANPSGKLTDTCAVDLYDYPSTESFLVYDNNVDYEEDIYVGYRYFETFAPEKVTWEFGYGLSYTTFDIKTNSVTNDDTNINVNVTVTNTGDVAGKEVVQVYYSAPQAGEGSAKISKSAIALAGYAKTELLEPGESQTMDISYAINDMASFDDDGRSGADNKSCYVLEAGTYDILVGNSVKNNEVKGSYTVLANVITERCSQLCMTTLEKRLTADGTYESLSHLQAESVEEEVVVPVEEEIDIYTDNYVGITYQDVQAGKATEEEFLAQMSLYEMIHLARPAKSIGIVAGSGTIGWGSSARTEKYGVYSAETMDGPLGIRQESEGIPSYPTVILPSPWNQACSWNLELIKQIGFDTGEIGKNTLVDVWLAPALNIHRSPMCGRNFEYYSEDPLVSGLCAATITNAVQSWGTMVMIKHFACNNQENQRTTSSSNVSERALREIYLRGFRIVVEDANPAFIMTSYNLINGVKVWEYSELLKGIVRGEWGWEYGAFSTDWSESDDILDEILNGNNVHMCEADVTTLEEAAKQGILTREILEENTMYMVRALARCADMTTNIYRVHDLAPNDTTVIPVTEFSSKLSRAYFGWRETDGGYYSTGLSWRNDEDNAKSYFNYKVYVEEAGDYNLGVRMHGTGWRRVFDIYVNDELENSVDVPKRDGAVEYPNEIIDTGTISLPAGESVIKLQYVAGSDEYIELVLTPDIVDVASGEGAYGETVKIDVTCDQDGVSSVLGTLSCDLTLVGITSENEGFEFNPETGKTIVYTADTEGFSKGDVLFTAEYAIDKYAADGLTNGAYEVVFDAAKITIDEEFADYTDRSVGYITVNTEYSKGDINLDGAISNADVIAIARYLVDLVEFTDEQLVLADIDDDGVVNNIDLIKIARSIVED